MEQSSAQTIASFTGTLLRREHTLGQKFVQLVFREDDHDVLCVSTDPQTAALPIGQMYTVEGAFRQRGGRSFLLEPKIAALKKHWRPIRRVLFVGIVLACVTGISGVAYMQQHHTTAQPSSAATGQAAKFTVATPAEPSTPAPTATAPAETPAPVSTPAPATTVSKPKTVVKTTTAAATTTPAVAAPVDTCTTQTIPFDTTQQASDSVAAGDVVTPGVAGSEQVCTLSGTTVTLQPVAAIISSGPAQ